MAQTDRSRRSFLAALISLLAGGWLVGRFLTPKLRPKNTLLTVAKAELPPDGALVYREARVALMRRGDSVYALDLVCTHLGCTVNVTPTGLVCPCHGSRFDREGKVLEGPADRPLKRYAVEADGDRYRVLV
ncbi:Ubiquinol-cytochrome C reductase iron-sulfur subunit [Citrifermentans bremense]|uniref:Ubiquinol-cytochrome C reductase iron-sulfur subunit n=1 Tax=Citrifermentans bremense TaxID=60035 RepID=A0A7R7FSN5_9BACT|nr:Rieske (2Fe-2S) protein [Citrifermentans bremense]BCO11641.1 Ubiquinol-cytochrome C reductase iron-sulfur subunit [Citrifermentans bremense]